MQAGTSDQMGLDDQKAKGQLSLNDRFRAGGWSWKLRLILGGVVLVLAGIAYLRDW